MPVSGTREQRISAIARLQRGRVARRQALAAGIGSSAITRMITRGLLHREHTGVYAVIDPTPRPLAPETGALLACGDRALVSHRSAAALWGLTPVPEGPVEVTIIGEASRRRPGIEVHRSGRLLARDIRIHQQLPATSPARTLLDLADQTPLRELERALDEALVVRRIVRRHELQDVVKRAAGRRGGAILADLLGRRGAAGPTQSEAEQQFLQLVRDAGLPPPDAQVRIAGFTIDFLWREQGVAFEIDGFRYHTSRSAFDRDRRKDAVLKAHNVDPNRVSRDQVKHEPLTVIAYVASALARADAHRAA